MAHPDRETGPRRIVFVLGTRPELVKLAPLIRVLPSNLIEVVYTGQHYSEGLYHRILDDLKLGCPFRDLRLSAG